MITSTDGRHCGLTQGCGAGTQSSGFGFRTI